MEYELILAVWLGESQLSPHPTPEQEWSRQPVCLPLRVWSASSSLGRMNKNDHADLPAFLATQFLLPPRLLS